MMMLMPNSKKILCVHIILFCIYFKNNKKGTRTKDWRRDNDERHFIIIIIFYTTVDAAADNCLRVYVYNQ